ncbi:MAG: hypothetical protein ACI9MC_003122 [Kiritimatiellia bacterium]|jgi:hypothetical protein
MGMTVANVKPETVIRWVDNTGVGFPVFMDESNTYNRYDQTAASAPFPLDVVIDKRGVVRYVSTRYEPEKIETVIEQLMDE